jgi:protein-disulfide isomerase
MQQESTGSPLTAKKRSHLTTPLAILLAGVLIAGATLFSGAMESYMMGGKLAGIENGALPPGEEPAPTVGDVKAVNEQDHVRGPANAKVTLIEYSDLECPFCKRFHTTLMQVAKEYPNDVKWVYRHFPIPQLHSQAMKEAVATECAGEQGKFWEMTDKIFEVTPSNDGLNLADLPKLAQEAGVANVAQFESCLESGKFDARIEADIADANAAGGQGTPHTVLLTSDGQKVPIIGAQPFESVKAAIDNLR